MIEIREYDATRDRAGVRRAFVELQDVERAIDPRMPAGEVIADRYLALMHERCAAYDGVVLVADAAGEVVGFVCVWTRYRSTEPDDDPAPYAYVSDLVVEAGRRGQGIGRALLRAAEARARDAGVHRIGLSVKAGNDPAIALYAAEGFAETERMLEKRLGGERIPPGS